MKKLLKPEIEFIEFDAVDVITTSGKGNTVNLADKSQTDTTGNAHDSKDYSSGSNSLWNKPQQ